MDSDLERLEKKIDLLYAVLLNVHADDKGWCYGSRYMSCFFRELLPLFGMKSIEERMELIFNYFSEKVSEIKEKIKPTKKKMTSIADKLKSGDYLKREEEGLKAELEKLEEEYEIADNEMKKTIKDVPSLQSIVDDAFLELKKMVNTLVDKEAIKKYYAPSYGWEAPALLDDEKQVYDKLFSKIQSMMSSG